MFAVDENDILREDTEKNPETDSYYYMEIIMEAFAVLGDIPTAMEVRKRLHTRRCKNSNCLYPDNPRTTTPGNS